MVVMRVNIENILPQFNDIIRVSLQIILGVLVKYKIAF